MKKNKAEVHVVSWMLWGGESFSYGVELTAKDAAFFGGIFDRYVASGYITSYSIVATDILSRESLLKILKDKFPRMGKEWLPPS